MRDLITKLTLPVALLSIPLQHLRAQAPLEPLRTDLAPVIDGNLDDAVWQEAPYVTEFRTYAPDYGLEMAGETRAYVAYDAENLYFAFRAFDSEPDKIKTSISSRDNISRDDWVAINLDSFNDQQSLYAFYVNPLGVQGDSRYAGGVEDRSVDLVWYSGGQVDGSGYSVEIRIPLKSIRFARADPVRMGVIFERHISRRSEYGTCPPLNPDRGESWLTQMSPLIFRHLERSILLELLPAVTYSHRRALDGGRLATEEERGDVSLTAKYGLTSDLILDGTYNPDFSQVEADAGQVDINLRYDLFFPEARPFFLEGRENFTIAAATASERDPVGSVIHTRTIVDPIAGVRLSGKIGSKNTVSSIYAVDELPDRGPVSGAEYAHFPIVRYKRALSEDSYIGGIYAGRELRDHFNRVLGADGQLRISESSTLGYHALLSQAKQDTLSQRIGGHAIGVHYAHGTRDVDYSLVVKDIAEDFRAEMGYVSRTGILQFSALLRPKLYPASSIVRRIDAELFTAQTRDKFSNLWETFNHISLQNYLWGSIILKVKYSYSTEVFLGEEFKTGGFHVFGGGQFTRQLYAGVLYRRVKAVYYSEDPYQGSSNRLTGDLIYQPSDNLRFDLSFIYNDFCRDSDSRKIYDYPITRGRLTYQVNRYLFFRGILEYNDYRSELLTDFLASFTYIPGTVIHIGYGSLYDKVRWENGEYVDSDRFLETKRAFFFKTSYLWRL
ncbi:MAG: hypothetical protein AMS25_08975 [Gemmatimonas sp. SM23_52]|nr:MAG: hypothetical protein AMS25_08975 [Gemmatimonas sp. SM23_52]